MPTEAMARKLDRGANARHDYEHAEELRAAQRKEDQEIRSWVQARFPLEKQQQAAVAVSMLRFIHGKGNVTVAMVKARMQAQDERYGICDQSTPSERSQ
jgi:hypothetical protein